MTKLRLGLLFGGRSVEHEVSIVSASAILRAFDPSRYDVSLIMIDPEGRWHLTSPSNMADPASMRAQPEVVLRGDGSGGRLIAVDPAKAHGFQEHIIDVFFPILHGRGGEDGALQGLLELAEVPYVGSGVLSSAVQMDKDFAKRTLQAAGLPVLPWVTLRSSELEKEVAVVVKQIQSKLSLPAFIKPANSGSSVGISKATDLHSLTSSLEEAAAYDEKIIVERAVKAREIEVAVLGDETGEASLPGEIIPSHDFYDYEAKYQDQKTKLIVPAEVSKTLTLKLQGMAVQAYEVLEARGMARVDFLVEAESETIWINELNSLPGFTSGSMYPRLWAESGLPFSALLDRLVQLAQARHARRARLRTGAPPGHL